MTLQELRDRLAALTGQAQAKRAELTAETAKADATRIESEHVELLAQISKTTKEIADAEAAERAAATETKPTVTVDAFADAIKEAVRQAQDTERTNERKRVAEINTLAKRFNAGAFGDTHIGKGTDLDTFRLALIDHIADAANAVRIFPHVQMGGLDATETRRTALIEFIDARGNSAPVPEKSREYRGMSLIDMAREVLSWEGVSTRGLTPPEIASRALMATSDFPNILAAGANKQLLAGYTAAPQTFRGWARRMTLSDFKTRNLLRLGMNPQLKKVNEAGEFKHGSITEGKESISLATYGIIVGFTRQLLINDDLSALTDVPRRFGNSASTLESDLVYGKLLANPALNTDSKAVFHTDHNNISAVNAAPSVTTISTGRVAMAKQKDLDAVTVLNLAPNFILVPPELETTAAQLQAGFYPATSANVVPEFVRQLQPISEARLSVGISNADIGITVSGSASAWYLAASPGQVDTIIYAVLDGQEAPFIDQRLGFDIDGIEIKCRHDFGCAAADYRGLYRNA